MTAENEVGKKHDQDKLRYDLVHPEALREITEVLTYGSRKYSSDNWKKVPDLKRRYFAALMRHMWAWWGGEDNDTETGFSHLAHAGCCLLFLIGEKYEQAN